MNYKNGYYKLFNEITDLIEQLKKVQQEAEQVVVKNDVVKKIEIFSLYYFLLRIL